LGSFKGGLSTMAENGLLSLGIMPVPSLLKPKLSFQKAPGRRCLPDWASIARSNCAPTIVKPDRGVELSPPPKMR